MFIYVNIFDKKKNCLYDTGYNEENVKYPSRHGSTPSAYSIFNTYFPTIGLSGTQVSKFNVLDLIIPIDEKKTTKKREKIKVSYAPFKR
jgi:hypothetical protein